MGEFNIWCVVTFKNVQTDEYPPWQNTFAFTSDETIENADDLSNVASIAISNFYNNHQTTGYVRQFMSAAVDRSPASARIDYYDLGPPPLPLSVSSPPFRSDGFTLGPVSPGGGSLPYMLAACLNYRASFEDIEPGVPGQRAGERRTGRLFIGPLDAETLSFNSGEVGLSDVCIDTLALAAVNMQGDFVGRWGVWSRLDRVIRPVVSVLITDKYAIHKTRRSPVKRTVDIPIEFP